MKKKSSRIAVSPLLPTRPRAPSVRESEASYINNCKLIVVSERVRDSTISYRPVYKCSYQVYIREVVC